MQHTLILSIQTFKLNSNNTQDYAHNGHTMKCNEYLTVTKIKDKYLCLLLLLPHQKSSPTHF